MMLNVKVRNLQNRMEILDSVNTQKDEVGKYVKIYNCIHAIVAQQLWIV